MYRLILVPVAVFVLATVTRAQPVPPSPLGSTLDPVNGVALIAWENDVGADTVLFQLDRGDCRGPAPAAFVDSGDPQQGIVQVPAGPPFAPSCLLRPGDHVYLMRYWSGQYIDKIGPYTVPITVWLPAVETP